MLNKIKEFTSDKLRSVDDLADGITNAVDDVAEAELRANADEFDFHGIKGFKLQAIVAKGLNPGCRFETDGPVGMPGHIRVISTIGHGPVGTQVSFHGFHGLA